MYSRRSAINELRQMPKVIKADSESWQHLLAMGCNHLEVYGELCAKIFDNENFFHEEDATRARQLRRPMRRLEKSITIMQDIVGMLGIIQQRTECMRRRVWLWNDDATLQRRYVKPELMEILEFLSQRYNYEWEVKDMVVLELERVRNNYDVQILLKAWQTNRHAGGAEFQDKLRVFYESMPIRALTDL